MNIWFVGRCLSWLHAAHNFSHFHSLWMGILFSFSLFFILWMALQLKFSISITTGFWVTGRAWVGKLHTFLFSCIFICMHRFQNDGVENYLSKCMLILMVYFNKSKVCVSSNKKWRMNHSVSLFLTILHHIKITNICIWQITSPYKPPSAYFIETICHLSVQPCWQ